MVNKTEQEISAEERARDLLTRVLRLRKKEYHIGALQKEIWLELKAHGDSKLREAAEIVRKVGNVEITVGVYGSKEEHLYAQPILAEMLAQKIEALLEKK